MPVVGNVDGRRGIRMLSLDGSKDDRSVGWQTARSIGRWVRLTGRVGRDIRRAWLIRSLRRGHDGSLPLRASCHVRLTG